MTSSNKADTSKNGRLKKVIMGCVLLAIAITIGLFSIFILNQPKRSVANFCEVAKDQKNILTSNSSNQELLTAYTKLEAVSPETIKSDIKTIRNGYKKVVNDNSSAIATGIEISSAENRRTIYVKSNCEDF